jgi:hypothetical protein
MQVSANVMEQDAQLVVRVPQQMADQLKEYATKLSREYGVPVSQAAAARRLLADGLGRAGFDVGEGGPTEAAAPKKAAKAKARR